MQMRSPKNLAIFLGIGFVLGLLVATLFHCLKPDLSEADRAKFSAEVLTTLKVQGAAWNRGDIDGFMADYWKSPDLRFASNNSIKTGWQETKDGYEARYPTDDAMGRLDFVDQTVEVLSPNDALVFGRFILYRKNDQPTGLFTLHLKRIDGAWQIVSDHTSTE